MDDSRIESAARRIEAALARIAAASETLQPTLDEKGQVAGAASDSSTADLIARHERLRETVEAGVRDLDLLIGKLER